jgi:1,4-alpha-glucan branching enzyme
MVKKAYSQTGQKCRLTFEVLPNGETQSVHICGEFNDWSPTRHPMKRRKDGAFWASLWVAAGRQYRFRYLLDGEQWQNELAADGYVPNPYGGEDCVLRV